jgi:hypothetical protein
VFGEKSESTVNEHTNEVGLVSTVAFTVAFKRSDPTNEAWLIMVVGVDTY